MNSGEWSQYGEVNAIIDKLISAHKQIFHDKMVGCYLYGSLVWGGFDISSSDIDTLCVLTGKVTAEEMKQLKMVHEDISNNHPMWNDRIEVHYAPWSGIQHFRTTSFTMGNISPGEPLHLISAGIEWIDEWYCVQEYAVTLFGIDKSKVIPRIEREEFIRAVCEYARSFQERIRTCKQSCYSQSYGILTLCRALYTLKCGEQISKPEAAEWAKNYLPEYKDVIEDALVWRMERDTAGRNAEETYALAEKFVDDILTRFFNPKEGAEVREF